MLKIVITSFLLIVLCNINWSFEIVVDGKTKCSIITEKDATVAEKNAALELQTYLLKITGNKVPIVNKVPTDKNIIIVGATALARKKLADIEFDKLAKDEVLINCRRNTLILAGGRPRGTIYAVYTFLETYLGCGFWTPDFETILKKKTITLGNVNYRHVSPFSYRQIYGETAHRYRNFAVKLKLNGEIWSKPISQKFGGGFKIDIRHTLTNSFLNSKKYFDKHPAWYAFRKKDKKRHKTQMCTSNSDALKKLSEEVMEFLAKNPNRRDFLSISFADNDKFCQCNKCDDLYRKHASISALAVRVANYIARKTIKKYPQLRIVLMAYWKTEKPPKAMKLEPNVAICFAMLDRNHNIPVARTGRHNKYLKEWKKLSHDQVYIWDYYASFGNFLLPHPSILTMEKNIRTYQEFGAKGVFAQFPFGAVAQLIDLRTWLFAKLLWNPSLDEKILIKQFLEANYENAAPYISEYIYMLDKVCQGKWLGVYGSKTSWLPVQTIIKAEQLFNKAHKSVADNVAIAKRVRKLTASLLMVEILRYDEVKKAKEKMNLPVKTRKQLIDELEDIGKEFKCSCYKEWDSFSNLIKKLRKNKIK
jgi:hypothetical protein